MLPHILRILAIPLLILTGWLLVNFSHIAREAFGTGLIILGGWHLLQAYLLTLKRYGKGLVIDAPTGKARKNKILLGLILVAAGIMFSFSNFFPKIF